MYSAFSSYVFILKEKQHFKKIPSANHILCVLNIIGNTINVITEGPEGQAQELRLKLNKQ